MTSASSSLYLGRQTWLRAWPEGLRPEKNEVASRGLIVHDDKVLLVYHANSDCWFTPGGRITPGESMTDGLGREIEEETGLQVELGDLVACFDVLIAKDRSHKFEFIFLAQPVQAPHFSARPHVDADPHGVVTEIRWFTRDEVRALPRVFPEVLRDWPSLLTPRAKAYYGTKTEEKAPSDFKLRNFRISTRAVATSDDKVLMVTSPSWGFYCCAGGMIEFGEPPLEATARELHEETGFTGMATELVGVDEFFSHSHELHGINLYIRCTLTDIPEHREWLDPDNGKKNQPALLTREQLAALPRAYPTYMAELAWPHLVKEKAA